ncbi:MAG: lipid II:glycine glycyltransferase FemX [Mahellales bacterium]|jgi:peptidoglycan pentaglycine glycine transferase (the first glycine)
MRLRETKDGREFNEIISNHPKGHILQSYEWGVLKSITWNPLYLIAEDGDKPVGGLMLLKRRVPGINKTMLYCPRGPVIDFHDKALLGFLVEELKKVAKEHRAISLKIDPDIEIEDRTVLDNLAGVGFYHKKETLNFEGVQPKFVFRLDISGDLDEVFNNFHSKTRYNVRLAGRKGVNVTKGNRQDLEHFHKIMVETGARDNFIIRTLDYFQRMYDILNPPGYLELFMAEYEGRPIAGTICLKYGDKCWYLYGASSNSHRNVMPNYLLQWEMIKWAKENGCTLYDFRGVSGDLSESNPLYGLYRFKKGFNGKFTEFIGEFDYPFNKFQYLLLENGISSFRKTRHFMYNIKKKLKG